MRHLKLTLLPARAPLALLLAACGGTQETTPTAGDPCADKIAECRVSQKACVSDASGAHCEACPAGKYAASSGSCAPIEGQAYSHDFSDFTVKPGEEVLGSGPSTAVGAIGKSLDKLASVILRERVERDIEGYVRRADPEVQSLLVALRAYVAAARVDVESVLAGQIQVIAAFERLTGLGAAATIAPCRVGAAAATAPEPPGKADGKDAAPDRASPETVTLRLVNQSLSLIGM